MTIWLLVSTHLTSVLPMVYLVLHFSNFCASAWLLHWPPSRVLKWYLVFLSTREKTHVRQYMFVPGTSSRAAGPELYVDDHKYTLNNL